jgi:hypothetical protein
MDPYCQQLLGNNDRDARAALLAAGVTNDIYKLLPAIAPWLAARGCQPTDTSSCKPQLDPSWVGLYWVNTDSCVEDDLNDAAAKGSDAANSFDAEAKLQGRYKHCFGPGVICTDSQFSYVSDHSPVSMTQDANKVFVLGISDSTGEAIVSRLDKSTFTLEQTTTLSGIMEYGAYSIDGDDNYVYVSAEVPGNEIGDGRVIRLAKANLGSSTTLVIPDPQPWALRVDDGHIYVVPDNDRLAGNYPANYQRGVVVKIRSSDFSLEDRATFTDGNGDWYKKQARLWIDADSIYVPTQLSGWAPPSTFEIYRINKSSFTQSDLIISTAGSTPGDITGDANNLYVTAYGPGINLCRIKKSSFSIDAIQAYGSGLNPFSSDGTYLYAGMSSSSAVAIMRIPTADLSTFEVRAISSGQNTYKTAVRSGSEFWLGTSAYGSPIDPHLMHLCSFSGN